MLNKATFHICPLFSQHVLGQKIHWGLPKERWPTLGIMNHGRIGGTKNEQQASKEPPKKRLRHCAFLAAL